MSCTARASWDGQGFTIERVVLMGMMNIPVPVSMLPPGDPGFGTEQGTSRLQLVQIGGPPVTDLEPTTWSPTRIVARVPAGRVVAEGVYGIQLDINNRDTQCQSLTPALRLPLIGGTGQPARGNFSFKCTRIHCVQATRDHELNADGWHDELRLGGWRLDVDLNGADAVSRGFERLEETPTMGDPNTPYKPAVPAPSSTLPDQVGFYHGRTHTGPPLPYELWRGELAQASPSGPGRAVVLLPVVFELDDEPYTAGPDGADLATMLGLAQAVLPGLGLPRDFLGSLSGPAGSLANLDRLWDVSILHQTQRAAFISRDAAHTRPVGSRFEFVAGQKSQVFRPDVIVLTYETASLLADRGGAIQIRLEEPDPWLEGVYEVDYTVERV